VTTTAIAIAVNGLLARAGADSLPVAIPAFPALSAPMARLFIACHHPQKPMIQ
jgi:hypothetical protein